MYVLIIVQDLIIALNFIFEIQQINALYAKMQVLLYIITIASRVVQMELILQPI